MNSIVSPAEAIKLAPVIIIDARAGGPDAYERFANGHWKNALYVDLDKDLSKKPENPAYGGRHPLPDIKDFGNVLGRLGIQPSTQVLVYDDKGGGNAAARFWWMMRSIGHEKIQVVDGGLNGLVNAGATITQDILPPTSGKEYPTQDWKLPLADIDVIEKTSGGQTDFKIIDVRENFRYRGESEPIDLIAGHIPGAINLPFIENLNSDGRFKSPVDLKEKYAILVGEHPENVIVHCGSGVTACHALLAMDYAGISGSKLYVGSWSEWSRREKPIAKDEV